jgi:predicted transcriptional regulator
LFQGEFDSAGKQDSFQNGLPLTLADRVRAQLADLSDRVPLRGDACNQRGCAVQFIESLELNLFPQTRCACTILTRAVGANMLSLEGRRSSIQIVAEILRLLRLGEAGKTEVMYTVNMSYYQTRKYLSWLLELGLVDKVAGEHRFASYRATSKGLQLLTQIEHMQEMLQVREAPEVLYALEQTEAAREQPYRRILKRLGDFARRR